MQPLYRPCRWLFLHTRGKAEGPVRITFTRAPPSISGATREQQRSGMRREQCRPARRRGMCIQRARVLLTAGGVVRSMRYIYSTVSPRPAPRGWMGSNTKRVQRHPRHAAKDGWTTRVNAPTTAATTQPWRPEVSNDSNKKKATPRRRHSREGLIETIETRSRYC